MGDVVALTLDGTVTDGLRLELDGPTSGKVVGQGAGQFGPAAAR